MSLSAPLRAQHIRHPPDAQVCLAYGGTEGEVCVRRCAVSKCRVMSRQGLREPATNNRAAR